MEKKTKTYVDTSAFIAFLDKSDTYHDSYKLLFGNPPPLITTTAVIIEGHGWFLRRYDTIKALQFLNFIETLQCLDIKEVSKKEIAKARGILEKFSLQNLTLVDALGLLLMKEYRIKQCFSTDRHLGLMGSPLVF
jgi:predicted nucleic acid-binding protein